MSDPEPSDTGRQEERDKMAVTFALKATLRKTMLRTLKGMSDSEIDKQSRDVFRILLDQNFFKKANSVGCYLSMAQGELRTNLIVDHLLKRGTSLYTPYIPAPPSRTHNPSTPSLSGPSSEQDMRMLRLYSTQDLENCPLDRWGIVDPGVERRDMDKSLREDAMNPKAPAMDLILIPGVAFDEECNRLGRGKAYYDRFLQSYTSTRPRPLLMAIALEPQILSHGERVPTWDWDFQLDGIISPSGIVWRKKLEGSN
ncbi:5-formyltetrahydrofolate cyclo-ligase [Cryptococcus neoformans var. grubii Br795]|uniref:5-formyltetrahydrofolate cyclo-ligase n=1 Tax=Cryptococcus neoformans Tu259-1 TaxID=1230072 RepID=A0A854QR04_CRYNE|nr:5-formyltetrahydrofolate cyclo-ligase [Cryptococcus neoformans var. grubii AD1-83a]OXG28949.1 5-formyltetrahydrofolate cyclo-ligase [Cryptococcus neoformans var. grubii Tu259-1]OXG45533.1 5-formyltetrahydrofolate cyclo-ligase [Cryptococcus neoformans var. grubii Bt120]OXG68853.1 5-formyltetrahydrofolate cyclo-ligase [Cryptococcus neoformans var. grubii c8]OXG69106.1 5-formyltetrahydrofolate cyclo-ligase [Cryptococcus neoformans var. grubii MW-RSA1955]OXG72596.1 5-formyltetrahydrofolate cycl